jgi:tRNA-specific 2-thiouridylase
MSPGMGTVAVGLSGGVDSAVAAALLLEQGYEVTGLILRLWVDEESEEDNRCCSPDSISLARKVARKLGIPFFVIDAREEFRKTVVNYFLESFKEGETPNPCVVCNKWIRWGFLKRSAENMGLEFFATGHYARIYKRKDIFHLRKGSDARKDQSYVLSRLTQNDLARTLFPLGDWVKTETRKKAASLNLPVSTKSDSQDLCFSGIGLSGFLKKHIPDKFQPGDIVNSSGKPIGMHEGLANYTIGQRKGIRIAGEKPYYVKKKDYQNNRLVVSGIEELGRTMFQVRDVNWIMKMQENELTAEVMVRYRSRLYPSIIKLTEDKKQAYVKSSEPIYNISPGQLAVFYNGEIVLGSGFITNNA